MQDKEILFPDEIYSEHLATINGIRFTRREVDVISCLLSARRTSQIASILSIAPRTVTTHFRNIMLRLDCNSQEGIINFIERSQKLSFLREHYVALTTEVTFEKSLKEISKLKHEGSPNGLIIYWEDENQKQILLTYLGGHLDLAGFKVEIKEYADGNKPEPTRDSYPISLLFVKKDLSSSCPDLKNLNSLDLSEHTNYYHSVLEILKALLPDADLSKIFATFQEHFGGRQDSFKEKMILQKASEKRESKETSSLDKILQIFQDKKWPLGVGIICISFLIMGCWILRGKEGEGLTSNSHQATSPRKDDSIRSDLVIPTESVLLSRPELISEIDNKLKSQHGIQTIALVGPGGAGKTTLARQYAHQQKASVIWEIDAETQGNLLSSFENLAQILAKREEDKNLLREIQDLKDLEKREDKIIQFVKEHLKSYSNWLLIFDNVEKFSNIQKYFPQDVATWGKGKIILTTRDTNIENNKHINSVFQIGELNPDQKFNLFTKIMNQVDKQPLPLIQTQETKAFLEHIPPFPLDISVAAYYLKATNTPYKAYLESLNQYNKDFANVEESLLKEAGDYTKTRYGIIVLSLQNIINAHKDFRELLLFISLLDSQNIPRDLLDKYKDKATIDNFIYNLKKHSLITNETLPSPSIGPTFSMHRSTQALTLAYLIKLLELNKNKNKNSIQQLRVILENYTRDAVDKEDFSKMDLAIKHCEIFLSHPKLLTDDDVASISAELGNAYVYVGNYEKARQLIEQSLAIYRKTFSENQPGFARALGCLGSVYKDLGDYEKAKILLEQSLTIYRKNSYEDHPWFAWPLGWLGSVYREQGDYEKAKQLIEESIAIFRKNSYENHPGFARALARLGSVYREQGNYEKARQLYEESIVIYKKNYNKNHPWFAQTLARLGNIYRDLGDYEKAKLLLEQSIAIYKSNSYENHSWYARALVWLGSVYREQGNYEKARQFLEEGLAIYRKNSYENHPWYARALVWLGSVYRDLGYHEKAKNLLEHTLQTYERIYGKDHIETAKILRNLCQSYLLEGNIQTSEACLQRALGILQKSDHPDAYKVLEDLGELYLKKANLEKKSDNSKQSENFKAQAIVYLKQALNIVKGNFPTDSPHTIRIEAKLKKLEKAAL